MGMLHTLGAIALGTLSLGAAKPDYMIVENRAVVQVMCSRGAGSAFRVSKTTYFTVAHVTGIGGCKVDGVPIEVTGENGGLDFAVFRLPASNGPKFVVNCDGVHRNDQLEAIGYADGLPFQRLLRVRGTGVSVALEADRKAMAIVVGPEFIPGMSGGPVLNRHGEVVSLVNAYRPQSGISFSRELKDTEICASTFARW